MMNRYDELMDAFEIRLRKLMHAYIELQAENKRLNTLIDRKQEDLMLAHQQIIEIRNSYDRLRIARTLGATEEEKMESKRRIQKIVREIDKCLSLLKE